MSINKAWHDSHKMPKNPSHEQRLVWHEDHEKNCDCRPMPASLNAPKAAKNPIVKDWRSSNPHASRQVTHNLRRRMGR